MPRQTEIEDKKEKNFTAKIGKKFESLALGCSNYSFWISSNGEFSQ